jgi:hypothetical protein
MGYFVFMRFSFKEEPEKDQPEAASECEPSVSQVLWLDSAFANLSPSMVRGMPRNRETCMLGGGLFL